MWRFTRTNSLQISDGPTTVSKSFVLLLTAKPPARRTFFATEAVTGEALTINAFLLTELCAGSLITETINATGDKHFAFEGN